MTSIKYKILLVLTLAILAVGILVYQNQYSVIKPAVTPNKIVAFRVLDNNTQYEIKDYSMAINNRTIDGKTDVLNYISSLPNGRYDYIVYAKDHKPMPSSFDVPEIYANNSDNDKIQVMMEREVSSNSEWRERIKQAESQGNNLMLGYISTPDYQPFPGVAITSDSSPNLVITDQNGFFSYSYKKSDPDNYCTTFHIKKDGYKELKVTTFSSGAWASYRLEKGTGVVDHFDYHNCGEDPAPTGTNLNSENQ